VIILLELLQQTVPLPTEDMNPWVWFTGVAVLVIGYLGKSVKDGYEKRAGRCETREDTILEDNKAQAATIKEMSSALLRNVSVTEGIGEAVKVANGEIAVLKQHIVDLNVKIGDLQRKLDDVHQSIESMDRPSPTPRRRTTQGG
jgi:hypothetical protein